MPLDEVKAKELLDKARQRKPDLTREEAKSLLDKANQSFGSQQVVAKETNVPIEKVEQLKKYRDFQPTAEMTPVQQIVGGMQRDKYRNIENEPTFFSKFAKKASDYAPVVGSTVAGTIGRFLGRKPGAVASGAGYGSGLAFGESLENMAGIQDETPAELAKEAVAEPLAVGATDFAVDFGLEKAGNLIKPFTKKVSDVGKGLVKEFLPDRKNIFKSIFTVPRKIASRMGLDEMSSKMIDYDIKGNLDDLELVSSKVTGKDGVLSKAVRDALGKVTKSIGTDDALSAAKNSADNALNLDDKVINKTLRKVTNMISKNQGELPGKASAIDLWDTVQALEKEGYNLMSKSTDMTPRIDMEQQGQIFLSAADSLKNQIDDSLVESGTIKSVVEKYIKAVSDINPKLAQEFSTVKNIRDIRSLAKPFVDLSNATRMTKDAGTSVMEKFITGQSKAPNLNPITWVNPIIQRPGVKSWMANLGKNVSIPKIPISKTLDIGRRIVTPTIVNESTK